jgi:hypothetical protein
MQITYGASGQQIAEFTDGAEWRQHVTTVHPAWNEPHVAQLIDPRSKQIMGSLMYSPVARLNPDGSTSPGRWR